MVKDYYLHVFPFFRLVGMSCLDVIYSSPLCEGGICPLCEVFDLLQFDDQFMGDIALSSSLSMSLLLSMLLKDGLDFFWECNLTAFALALFVTGIYDSL